MEPPLVSVIMPAYSASSFIQEAINSLILQTYNHWELLVVNDGSTDDTENKVREFDDSRIRLYSQGNRGVSAARNLAIAHMKGNFFCFLDADDVLPKRSLQSRLEVFERDTEIDFVDGWTDVRNLDLSVSKRIFKPSFRGKPLHKLVSLSEECYFGLTWMVRVKPSTTYRFNETMTHSEDLLFFISLANEGKYNFVDEPVLIYRTGGNSAMSNLKGLERGYMKLYHEVIKFKTLEKKYLVLMKRKIMGIMVKSYLKKGMIISLITFIFRFLKNPERNTVK